MARLLLLAIGSATALLSFAGSGRATGAQASQPDRFLGGPGDGLSKDRFVSRDSGLILVEVGPSTPGASPVAAENQSSVTSLLNAYRVSARLPADAIAVGATSVFCERDLRPNCPSRRFTTFPIGAGYSVNTPYQLEDGRVRLEWLRHGRVRFLSYLTLSEGKVVNILTMPPVMPVAAAAPIGVRPNG